jgi:hypothetical protein
MKVEILLILFYIFDVVKSDLGGKYILK